MREIIANGLRYTVGPVNPDKPANWKGFGGRRYTIQFLDDKSILKTDDLNWDYSFKNQSRPDTAVIFSGWYDNPDNLPICGWHRAGDYNVFGPIVPERNQEVLNEQR